MSQEVCLFSSYVVTPPGPPGGTRNGPRDFLLVAGDPRPLHRDLELHLLSLGIRHDDETMELLKDGLSALALYQISRPRFQSFGWTISLQSPPRNLFFTGSPEEGTVVGRAFLEDVQDAPSDRFFAQSVWPHGESRTSAVEIDGRGGGLFAMVEEYCRKSDQLPLRLLRRDDGRVALLLAFPEAPRDWFSAAQAEEVFALERTEKPVKESRLAFRCGCDVSRIARVLRSIYRDDPEEIFLGDPELEAECPRCGAKYRISREDLAPPAEG